MAAVCAPLKTCNWLVLSACSSAVAMNLICAVVRALTCGLVNAAICAVLKALICAVPMAARSCVSKACIWLPTSAASALVASPRVCSTLKSTIIWLLKPPTWYTVR